MDFLVPFRFERKPPVRRPVPFRFGMWNDKGNSPYSLAPFGTKISILVRCSSQPKIAIATLEMAPLKQLAFVSYGRGNTEKPRNYYAIAISNQVMCL